MKVYCYSKETKEFLGEKEANINPLKSKRVGKPSYFIPPNSTTIDPPKLKENQIAIFNMEKREWEVKDDYRGYIYYTFEGEQNVITKIGEIPDKKYPTFLPPPQTMIKPYWNLEKKEWDEMALKFRGIPVLSRDSVNSVIDQLISNLNEKQILSEKLIANDKGESYPPWDEFVQKRNEILTEGRAFKDTYFPLSEE